MKSNVLGNFAVLKISYINHWKLPTEYKKLPTMKCILVSRSDNTQLCTKMWNYSSLKATTFHTTHNSSTHEVYAFTSVYDDSTPFSLVNSSFNLHVIKGLGFASDMELSLLKWCYRLHFLCKLTRPLRRSSFFKSLFLSDSKNVYSTFTIFAVSNSCFLFSLSHEPSKNTKLPDKRRHFAIHDIRTLTGPRIAP